MPIHVIDDLHAGEPTVFDPEEHVEGLRPVLVLPGEGFDRRAFRHLGTWCERSINLDLEGRTAATPKVGDTDELPCVRCQTPPTYVAERDFREGTGGWALALGRMGALFEDSTRLEVWACQSCGHVEFFVPGVGE